MVDVLHGVEVADPYRWLEDGESEETAAWVAAQNARTRTVLDALPARPGLRQRMLALLQAGTSSAPSAVGDVVFALEREGEAEQARLVVYRAGDHHGAPAVVLDPATLSGDATAAIDWYHPSPDGRLVAWGMSEGGSERSTLRVMEVATGATLPDVIHHTRAASVAWLPDGSAFAYTRYPPDAELGRRVWWHRLGDDPAGDTLLFGDQLDDETAWPDVSLSPDGRWALVHVAYGWTRTDVHLLDRHADRWQVVIAGEEAVTSAQVVGDRLYAVTNLGAPRGRVIAGPVTAPQPGQWKDLVPESDAVIEGAVVAGPSLLVVSSQHAVSHVRRHPLDGAGPAEDIALPELGSVAGLDADLATERAFVVFTSFTRPAGLWRWTPDTGLERWSRFPLPVDPDAYGVEQVFFDSTDGTRIPMFLVGPAGAEPSPDTPTVLTGYGGFAISMSPAFGPGTVAWADAGGLTAVACLRGGSEYGEDWHRAGMLAAKARVFDDFCAAADWLVARGHTSRDRLAIRGGSNGGLLVGAALTRRPDLCRAAVCAVPLLDMLRFHRFLIGALWVHEYGDPDDPEAFAWLSAYSPYHHVADGTPYPATLFMTAESDSRVDPLHARKMAARLQAAQASLPAEAVADRPVLLRVETRAGHGVGKPASKQADELADTWAFLGWQLRVDSGK